MQIVHRDSCPQHHPHSPGTALPEVGAACVITRHRCHDTLRVEDLVQFAYQVYTKITIKKRHTTLKMCKQHTRRHMLTVQ